MKQFSDKYDKFDVHCCNTAVVIRVMKIFLSEPQTIPMSILKDKIAAISEAFGVGINLPPFEGGYEILAISL